MTTHARCAVDARRMRPAALVAFVIGVCALQWQASLPGPASIALIGLRWSGMLLSLFAIEAQLARARAMLLLVSVCLGFAYAAGHATWRMADELAFDDEGRDIAVVGDDCQPAGDAGARRQVRVRYRARRRASVHVPARVLLGWYSGNVGGDRQCNRVSDGPFRCG